MKPVNGKLSAGATVPACSGSGEEVAAGAVGLAGLSAGEGVAAASVAGDRRAEGSVGGGRCAERSVGKDRRAEGSEAGDGRTEGSEAGDGRTEGSEARGTEGVGVKGLLSPLAGGGLCLGNRVVMAPMSRRRAPGGVPGASMVTYYGQRAGAGLIITENAIITPNGAGYFDVPGIYSPEQQAGWRPVVDAVHARGGTIFMQLVHSGRIGHPLNQGGLPMVAPSAVQAPGLIRTPGEIHLPMPVPEVLSLSGVQETIDVHIQAAVAAIEVGFDGVEIHGAHGFLPDQFLNPHTNLRTDGYGGSIAGRSRVLIEIMEGVSAAIGAGRTGVRLSPFGRYNDMSAYGEEVATHAYVVEALKRLGILYIHLSGAGPVAAIPTDHIQDLRRRWPNWLMLAGGFDAVSGEAAVREGIADLIAYGRPFISNPDLVERFRRNIPLAEADDATFYQGGDRGYIDYPLAAAGF